MNAWQLSQQLAYLAKARVWPDGTGEKVLGDCVITAATDEDTFGILRAPYLLINVGESPADRTLPDFYLQAFSLALGVIVEGDRFGQSAIIGGARSGGQGASAGRGLLEVEEEILAAVAELTGANGVNAACAYKSGIAAGIIQGRGYVAQRAYRIECSATAARYYHPPQNLAKSGNTVSWTLPPDRWDRYQIILRKASGSTPPASATAGTGVTLGSNLATSVTDATTGTWTYAIFCAYDEKHTGTPATAQRYSSAATTIPGTTLTVT